MLKKLGRNLERKKDGKVPVKFRFDVQILELRGVPSSVDQCRIVWSRGAKVQMTEVAHVKGGIAAFGGKVLAQVATVYKGTGNSMDPKDYTFKVQVQKDEKNVTLGKGVIDLGQFASLETEPKEVIVPIKFSAGAKELGAGELGIIVSSDMMKGFSPEDGMTVMSGLSGLSSPFDNQMDQDLSGFDAIPENEVVQEDQVAKGLTNKMSGRLSSSIGEAADTAQSTPQSRGSVGEEVLFDSMRLKSSDIAEFENRIQELEEKVQSQRKTKASLEKQLKDSMAKAQSDLDSAKRQLDGERAEKLELEAQMRKEIAGEIAVKEAVEKAVAVWEVRYQRLKEESQIIRERADEELDDAHQSLLSYQEQSMELENQLQSSERAREAMLREKRALESTLMETTSDHMELKRAKDQVEKELSEVRSQYQKASGPEEFDGGLVMTELIETKVKLAELDEMHTVARHELYKSRETNMLLASKMTKLETYLYKKRQEFSNLRNAAGVGDQPMTSENGVNGNGSLGSIQE